MELVLKPLWSKKVMGFVLWSPDGERIVAGDKIFDSNGVELWEIPIGSAGAISPDGKYLVALGGLFKGLYFYDLYSKKEVANIRTKYVVHSVDWSSSGKYVVAAQAFGVLSLYEWHGNRVEHLWTMSPVSSEELKKKNGYTVLGLFTIHFKPRFHPKSDLLALGFGRSYYLLDLSEGKLLCSRELWNDTSTIIDIESICFNSSGDYIAIAANNGELIILEFEGGDEIYRHKPTDAGLRSIVWVDDHIFVGDNNGYIHVYRWNEKEEVAELTYKFKAASEGITWDRGLAFNPKYGLLAVSSKDSIYVYDVSELISVKPSAISTADTSTHAPIPPMVSTISVMNLLSESVSGLVLGYPDVKASKFTMVLYQNILPLGFEGSWKCIKLGCGGWGCAYRCEQGNRVVVFKVPRGYEQLIESNEIPTVSEKLMKKIVDLAETLKKLKHPHILRLLGYSKKAPLLAYEYANYGSLEWQLSKGWRPGLKEVVLISIQLADALRYIHSRGLTHCDIKASNVFFVNGIAKLGDFSSLVKLLSRTSSHSRFAYTLGWRAPEQVYSDLCKKARELGYENRIDIYQLGNLILYMLTEETIDGEDAIDEKQVKDVVSMIEHEELKEVLCQVMRYNPWERPSAEEVAKKLVKVYIKL